MITVVVVDTFAVFALRLFIQQNESSTGGSIAGGALNAITIMILNTV